MSFVSSLLSLLFMILSFTGMVSASPKAVPPCVVSVRRGSGLWDLLLLLPVTYCCTGHVRLGDTAGRHRRLHVPRQVLGPVWDSPGKQVDYPNRNTTAWACAVAFLVLRAALPRTRAAGCRRDRLNGQGVQAYQLRRTRLAHCLRSDPRSYSEEGKTQGKAPTTSKLRSTCAVGSTKRQRTFDAPICTLTPVARRLSASSPPP